MNRKENITQETGGLPGGAPVTYSFWASTSVTLKALTVLMGFLFPLPATPEHFY